MNRWRHWAHVGAVLMVLASSGLVRGFTLIGPTQPTYAPVVPGLAPNMTGVQVTYNGTAAGADQPNNVPNLNFKDPMGNPVQIKEFYRWQYPILTYAFDPTFVQYFGRTGMEAMSNVFNVLNDYFNPADAAYTNGVSGMDLVDEYHNHFSTWYFNPSANINNVTDIETLTLGLLVNHLGLGNPHRYAFVIQDIIGLGFSGLPNQNNNFGATGTFQIAIRNYDPYTYEPSTTINGVDYSYYIASGPEPNVAAGIRPTWYDAIEYAVSSDDIDSAVAGIRDVVNFGGLAWPISAPTVFRTAGVFFAEDFNNLQPSRYKNKVRNQPRHALTWDDAGGLKYLYRTNNLAVETLTGVTLVELANMNPITASTKSQIRPNQAGQPYVPQRRTLTGLVMSGLIPSAPTGGILRPPVAGLVADALRGGINTIRFDYTAYDSLLGQTFDPKSYEWTDVFILDAMPTDQLRAQPPYFQQRVMRAITAPDIIFTAQDIPILSLTLPVITLPAMASWVSYAGLNTRIAPLPQNSLGPGIIYGDNPITYTFSKRAPFYNILYGGEQSLAGSLIPQFTWGWITNTGPSNYLTFPERAQFPAVEGAIAPSATVPVITGLAVIPPLPPAPFTDTGTLTLDRCTDDLYVYGRRFDTAVTIEVVDQNGAVIGLPIQAIEHIVSDQVIKLEAGTFSFTHAGAGNLGRRLQVKNSAGTSLQSDIFIMNHGIPVIFSTNYDGLPWNFDKTLRIRGIGFTNSVVGQSVTRMHFFSAQTNTPAISVLDLNSSVPLTDSEIIIPAGYLKDATVAGLWSAADGIASSLNAARSDHDNIIVASDGFTRRIRLSGNVGGAAALPAGVSTGFSSFRPEPSIFGVNHHFSHLGAGGGYGPGNPLSPASARPTITGVTTTLGPARELNRDLVGEVLQIQGTGLDLALTIEFVDGTGKMIQVINLVNNLPPFPLGLRSPVEPSALGAGISYTTPIPPAAPTPGIIPASEITQLNIDVVTFGMPAVNFYDSLSGNNLDTNRLVVIRTPFGTAVQDPVNVGSPALYIVP